MWTSDNEYVHDTVMEVDNTIYINKYFFSAHFWHIKKEQTICGFTRALGMPYTITTVWL